MKIYHQTGFRYNWNIESYKKDIGDGIIYSPVNIDSDKLLGLAEYIKNTGFLDPQLYLLYEAKGQLDTYPYFPGNLKYDFSTIDLETQQIQVAKLCVDFQIQNNFKYLVIPTRYHEVTPSNFYYQSSEQFVYPFCEYAKSLKHKKEILLTVIVKKDVLIDTDKRDEILNWITGHLSIDGVYLIFENNFTGKQIKDFDYLLNALRFIKILKDNQLQVHIGYTNTEAILYSVAFPDSITIGSYENLRSFGIKRFQDTENGPMRAPNARLYSSKLLQWIEYIYIQAMKNQISDYDFYFDDTEYKPLMFKPDFNWHFNKSEPYKHYFEVFVNQIKSLPQNPDDRFEFVKVIIKNSIDKFKQIENEHNVLLDENSNGSHLPTWYNVVNAFQKELKL